MATFIDIIIPVKDVFTLICELLDDTSIRHLTMTCKTLHSYAKSIKLKDTYLENALASEWNIVNIKIKDPQVFEILQKFCNCNNIISIIAKDRYFLMYDFPNTIKSIGLISHNGMILDIEDLTKILSKYPNVNTIHVIHNNNSMAIKVSKINNIELMFERYHDIMQKFREAERINSTYLNRHTISTGNASAITSFTLYPNSFYGNVGQIEVATGNSVGMIRNYNITT